MEKVVPLHKSHKTIFYFNFCELEKTLFEGINIEII
jgi:hypothetical protein